MIQRIVVGGSRRKPQRARENLQGHRFRAPYPPLSGGSFIQSLSWRDLKCTRTIG